MFRSERGFTLVEVTSVIAIVGLLATVATSHLASEIKQVRVSADMYQGRIITEAIDLFHITKGKYPASVTELRETGLLGKVMSAQQVDGHAVKVDDESLGRPVFQIDLAKGTVSVIDLDNGKTVFTND